MSHANAALTPRHRLKVACLVVDDGWPISEVAARFQVSWGRLSPQRCPSGMGWFGLRTRNPPSSEGPSAVMPRSQPQTRPVDQG